MATTPAPTRSIYMRCTENRVEDDYDGGLVLMQIIAGQKDELLTDARLAVVFKHDTEMSIYPVTRDEKQSRFFRIDIVEVPYTEIPPDPNAPPAPAQPTVQELLQQAVAVADHSGDTALADSLRTQLAALPGVPPS